MFNNSASEKELQRDFNVTTYIAEEHITPRQQWIVNKLDRYHRYWTTKSNTATDYEAGQRAAGIAYVNGQAMVYFRTHMRPDIKGMHAKIVNTLRQWHKTGYVSEAFVKTAESACFQIACACAKVAS